MLQQDHMDLEDARNSAEHFLLKQRLEEQQRVMEEQQYILRQHGLGFADGHTPALQDRRESMFLQHERHTEVKELALGWTSERLSPLQSMVYTGENAAVADVTGMDAASSPLWAKKMEIDLEAPTGDAAMSQMPNPVEGLETLAPVLTRPRWME